MKTTTYRFLLVICLANLSVLTVKAQNVGINTSGALPSINAILDLNTGNTNNLGLLIPNVTLGASLTTFNPPIATAPAAGDKGMMVYNTGGVQTKGYYYWDGGTWVSVSGVGAVTAANSGVSLNGATVTLGNAFAGTSGKLLQNTEIPLNGYNIDFSGSGNIGIDLAVNTVANQALEIGQMTNTMRINGLKPGASYQTTPGNPSTYLMYSDVNGDVNSIPVGTAGYVMMQTNTGPLWQPIGASSVFADNGLSMGAYTSGYVELGGTPAAPSALLGNSVIAGSGYSLDFDLGTYTAGGTGSFLVTNGGSGNPVLTVTSSTPGVGVNVSSPESTLDDNGSYGVGIVDFSPTAGSTTTLTNAYSTIIATPPAIASTYTLALPSATANPRRVYTLVYNGNSLGTIDITSPTAGSITLNGGTITPLQLSSNSITIQSDGTNWNVINASGLSTMAAPYFQTGSIGYGTHGNYSWTVPSGINQVEVFLIGAGGGCSTSNGVGGSGGMVTGILAVTPGEVFYVVVGQGGTAGILSTTGIGGGGGGSYIQQTNSSGALLCGAGGGGGGAGSTYSETIGGSNYFGSGFGGGGWFSNTIANLSGGSAVASASAASGKGGASYWGYLTNSQSWKGLGLTNNPTSGKTYATTYSTGAYGVMQTSVYGYSGNGAALMNAPGVPVNPNPNAGNGATANTTAAVDGEVAIIW